MEIKKTKSKLNCKCFKNAYVNLRIWSESNFCFQPTKVLQAWINNVYLVLFIEYMLAAHGKCTILYSEYAICWITLRSMPLATEMILVNLDLN